MTIKLVIADVDGTLVTPHKTLTARAQKAVAQLRRAGVAFAITSGRPPRGMAMLARPLELSTPIAAFNGGLLVAPDLVTILEQRCVPAAVATEVVDFLLRADLDVWVYRGAEWIIRRDDAPHVEHERQTVQFEPLVKQELRPFLDAAVKIVGVSDDRPRVARCEAELREKLGAFASVARSQPYYLDVTHPDANKGTVVRELSRRLAVPLAEVATIGDMPNDVLMFSVAGLSIAMGNASPEVQRCAARVTSSNADEGFANAVERFILGTAATVQASLGLPPPTRACLFDLDGVLTQTATLHAAAWKQAFDEFLAARAAASGEPFVPFDVVHDYDRYVDGKPRDDGTRAFLASRGLALGDGSASDPPAAKTIHGLGARKTELFVALLAKQHVSVYEGSVRYVRAARQGGLRTAVVSSSQHCHAVLVAAGLEALFDARIDGNVAAAEHLAGKPAPDTYLAAARALDVDPAEAAVFEDALAGVAAGRAGRFGYVVGVDRAGQAAELRRHGADVVVTDLGSLMIARGDQHPW